MSWQPKTKVLNMKSDLHNQTNKQKKPPKSITTWIQRDLHWLLGQLQNRAWDYFSFFSLPAAVVKYSDQGYLGENGLLSAHSSQQGKRIRKFKTYPWLNSKFKASLGYVRPCLYRKEEKGKGRVMNEHWHSWLWFCICFFHSGSHSHLTPPPTSPSHPLRVKAQR